MQVPENTKGTSASKFFAGKLLTFPSLDGISHLATTVRNEKNHCYSTSTLLSSAIFSPNGIRGGGIPQSKEKLADERSCQTCPNTEQNVSILHM